MAKERLRVAVIGGGFGGIYFLRELEKLRSLVPQEIEVLLFEPRPNFIFTPLLHEVATAGLDLAHVTIPYEHLLKSWTTHIRHRVTKINFKERRVTAGKAYAYDYLLLATGSSTNYFGIKSAEKHAYGLKTTEDAMKIRYRLEELLSKAAHAPKKAKQYLSIAIVGGGATGVELAAEICQFLKHRQRQYPAIPREAINVSLIQGANRLLPSVSSRIAVAAYERLEKLGVTIMVGTRVTNVLAKGVALRGGKASSLPASLVIWTAGIVPERVEGSGKTSHYCVNPDLSLHEPDVPGAHGVMGDPRVFAIGDATRYHDGCALESMPALAQVAVQQGAHVARNVVRQINGRSMRIYHFHSKGFLVSLGQGSAAGELETPFGKLFLRGFFAWWLWRTVYLFKFLDAGHALSNVYTWTCRLFSRRSLLPEKKL